MSRSPSQNGHVRGTRASVCTRAKRPETLRADRLRLSPCPVCVGSMPVCALVHVCWPIRKRSSASKAMSVCVCVR
eukprot:6335857-Lingulodinium_polyedra.AAC.1